VGRVSVWERVSYVVDEYAHVDSLVRELAGLINPSGVGERRLVASPGMRILPFQGQEKGALQVQTTW
jgi:hypothetical protein